MLGSIVEYEVHLWSHVLAYVLYNINRCGNYVCIIDTNGCVTFKIQCFKI